MGATKITVVTPPEFSLAPGGKLQPSAHIEICDVLLVDGAQFGKSKPHRACLKMQPDGSWDFEPCPLHPETGLPFTFTDADRAAWNGVLDSYEAGYGVANHVAVSAAGRVLLVSYERAEGGAFERVEKDVTDLATADVREQVVAHIGLQAAQPIIDALDAQGTAK